MTELIALPELPGYRGKLLIPSPRPGVAWVVEKSTSCAWVENDACAKDVWERTGIAGFHATREGAIAAIHDALVDLLPSAHLKAEARRRLLRSTRARH